jgi:DeoR/GlpR family transcriptional regulator of sugar metabolism
MLADERRNQIVAFAEEKGFVSLSQLVEHVNSSESTVRRDLEYLDGIGQIRRTRGGCAYVGESLTGFEERQYKASAEKAAIADAAADLVCSDETVILDGGTTTLEVARRLSGKSLQVVTNSLPIASLLMNQRGIELIFVGGYLYPKTGVALGPLAVETLKSVHARRLVMSVGGITEDGLFNSNALLVETECQMMEAAEEVIVVCTSQKLGHSSLARLAPLDRVHRMVVDSGISKDWRKRLEAKGIELTIVDSKKTA